MLTFAYTTVAMQLTLWLCIVSVYGILTRFVFHAGCNCSSVGSNNPEGCDRNGGQCSCKSNVIGRTCEQCRPDYFNFSSGHGCQGEEVIMFVYCLYIYIPDEPIKCIVTHTDHTVSDSSSLLVPSQ